MEQEKIIQSINDKYKKQGENPDTYFKGLLESKPLNYWDYIEVETLLSLQRPRTDFKDEEIFILYHQVTELVLKLMLHEIKQIVEQKNPDEAFLISKLKRLNRYTSMLITSFSIMKDGMSYEDYNTFRSALAPASGFQSAQFRYIEIYCTRLINLINEEGRKRISGKPAIKDYFDHIYWKDAGLNRQTGAKTLTMRQFEEKYLDGLIRLAENVAGNTVEEIILRIKNPSEELISVSREFDKLYNIEWPKVHLGTAQHYLDSKGETKAATGGSEWKKYLHPKYQQRKFFPEIWTNDEKSEWGRD